MDTNPDRLLNRLQGMIDNYPRKGLDPQPLRDAVYWITNLRRGRAGALSREKEANRDWSTEAKRFAVTLREIREEIVRLKSQRDRAWRALQIIQDAIETGEPEPMVITMAVAGCIGPRDVDEWNALIRESKP